MKVVVINSGSSSVKYEIFESSDFSVLSSGLLERIGESESRHIHRAYGPSGAAKETVRQGRVANHEEGFRFILSMARRFARDQEFCGDPRDRPPSGSWGGGFPGAGVDR
jgi:acetate kinase